jgi:GT2 family glycosyltransferase
MPKVTLIQVVYNSLKFIPQVFDAALNQTYKDTEFVAIIAGNSDEGKEYILEHFPQVKVIDPGYNIGFSRGHNEFFAQSNSEFFQLVNPDLIMTPTYVEEMLKVFGDPKVGAATGKLLRYDFTNNNPLNVIDSTGVIYAKSGGGRDRGQHEIDQGQYDNKTSVVSVSGAGPMYRKVALENIRYKREDGRYEYFDEDFHSYWEDVDLGLRATNAGWKCVYAPKALAYHGRAAGSSVGGYKKLFSFIKFHSAIDAQIRKLNYKNHIFVFIKNSPKFYLQFFIREFFMFGFITVFETRTLAAIPELIGLLPKMWRKRKFIAQNRKIPLSELTKLIA